MKINRQSIDVLVARKGLSRKELADKCGVCYQRMTRILNSQNVRPCTVGKLARVLGVDVTEIIEEEQ